MEGEALGRAHSWQSPWRGHAAECLPVLLLSRVHFTEGTVEAGERLNDQPQGFRVHLVDGCYPPPRLVLLLGACLGRTGKPFPHLLGTMLASGSLTGLPRKPKAPQLKDWDNQMLVHLLASEGKRYGRKGGNSWLSGHP